MNYGYSLNNATSPYDTLGLENRKQRRGEKTKKKQRTGSKKTENRGAPESAKKREGESEDTVEERRRKAVPGDNQPSLCIESSLFVQKHCRSFTLLSCPWTIIDRPIGDSRSLRSRPIHFIIFLYLPESIR